MFLILFVNIQSNCKLNLPKRAMHSWVQRKLSSLSPLNPLNILLSINGPLHSLGFNGLND